MPREFGILSLSNNQEFKQTIKRAIIWRALIWYISRKIVKKFMAQREKFTYAGEGWEKFFEKFGEELVDF